MAPYRVTAAIVVALLAAGSAHSQPNKPVAIVNGEVIARNELDHALRYSTQDKSSYVSAAQIRVEEQTLSLLIDDRLVHQFIAKNAPQVNPMSVEKKFSALLDALQSQKTTLAEYCRDTHQTEKQLRAAMEAGLRWNAYLAKAMTDADLQKYYTDYKDYFDGVCVECSCIVYFTSQKASLAEREHAARKMRELRQQIIDRKYTFAEAAKKFSHSPDARNGGNLGWIKRKWSVEESIAKAAFALKVDEISDVITTDFGVHLIKVTDRSPGKPISVGSFTVAPPLPEHDFSAPVDFSKDKDKVKESYADELRMNLIADLRKTAKIEVLLK